MQLPRWLGVAGGLLLSLSALALCGCTELMSRLDLDVAGETSTPEDGLREALRVGTDRAVQLLSAANGYLGNPEVRIPVPEKLQKIAEALELIGAGRQVDEFVTSMNRAAEAAAPVARGVFVDSINAMTFDDAMTILRGEAHEATDYFREHAGPRLDELFRPIVSDKLESVGATRAFNDLMDQTARLPFVGWPAFDLTGYVTEQALDGLFRTIGRQEELIREDPVARTTELLKKWFGEPE
jgi:hypothetical protein